MIHFKTLISYLSHRIIDSFSWINNYKINNSSVSPEGPKARANKIGIDFMIFISIFVENCL